MPPEEVRELLKQELLTVADVMRLLHLSRNTVIAHIQDGWLAGFRAGNSEKSPWRIYATSVKERMYGHLVPR
jgi:Helix-turn-helix domain